MLKTNSFGLALVLVLAATAAGETIDLAGHGSFVLRQGQQMTIQFSIWNYGYNNPGYSPYPTSIGLELIGADPVGGTIATVPGTGSRYLSSFLLQGTLESLDGKYSAPLENSAATLLGLSSGSLLLMPCMYQSSSADASMAAIEAEATLSTSLSEQIFGPAVGSRQSSALLVLRNLGNDLTIGGGNEMSLRNAIMEPGVAGLGGVQTSGITRAVTLTDVPEPGTIALTLGLIFGLAILLVKRGRMKQPA